MFNVNILSRTPSAKAPLILWQDLRLGHPPARDGNGSPRFFSARCLCLPLRTETARRASSQPAACAYPCVHLRSFPQCHKFLRTDGSSGGCCLLRTTGRITRCTHELIPYDLRCGSGPTIHRCLMSSAYCCVTGLLRSCVMRRTECGSLGPTVQSLIRHLASTRPRHPVQ
jgi:hypothetical protein